MDADPTPTTEEPRRFPSYETLGVRVHGVQIPDVVDEIQRWIRERKRCHYIAVTGMHGVVEAQGDEYFRSVLNNADLVVPDGMPLVWLARHAEIPLRRRVYGPELMETFLKETGDRYRHFLYGGAPGVAEKLAEVMRRRFGNHVVGSICPPFRELTDQERRDIAEQINEAAPDVIWVGLSTPKQERWMHDSRDVLRVPAAVGVGAAFDFLAGLKSSAPSWMQEHGLEWLFRLVTEPRRLWRRYILGGGRFVIGVSIELLRKRRADRERRR